jgi:hypothetical protein
MREDYPEMRVTDIARQLGENWKNFSEEEKQVWADLAAEHNANNLAYLLVKRCD